MSNLVIVGAGGHGQVVADAVLQHGMLRDDIHLVGFVDDCPDLLGALKLGYPVLGPVAALGTVPHDAVILAVGDNPTRRRLYEGLAARGERFLTIVHPSAVVSRDVVIGAGSFVAARVVVNTGTVIGCNCILNTACTVDHHCVVADHAHVAPGVHAGGAVEIGEGALLGIGSMVIPCQHIGAWATVGAGACVTRPVPAGITVAGVPARTLVRSAA